MTPKPIDKVGLCVLRDGRLLLARSHGQDYFQIPGGKVEPSDADDVAALAREIHEELGVRVLGETARLIGTFSGAAAGKPGLVVVVKLYNAAFEGEPEASSEIAELRWHDIREDAEDATEVVRSGVLPHLRGRHR